MGSKNEKPEAVLGEGIHTIPKLFLFWDMSHLFIWNRMKWLIMNRMRFMKMAHDGPSSFYSPIC